MRKNLLILLLTFATAFFYSCRETNNNAPLVSEDSIVEGVLSVDSLFADPDKFVGRYVTVSGQCIHVCDHGAHKAFLLSEADSARILRAEATNNIKCRFPQSAEGRKVVFSGIFRKEHIDPKEIESMIHRHKVQVATILDEQGPAKAAEAEKALWACPVELQSYGQVGITDFAASIADLRARIEQRDSLQHRRYLTFYFIDVDTIR